MRTSNQRQSQHFVHRIELYDLGIIKNATRVFVLQYNTCIQMIENTFVIIEMKKIFILTNLLHKFTVEVPLETTNDALGIRIIWP